MSITKHLRYLSGPEPMSRELRFVHVIDYEHKDPRD